jgi:hypothetical protein
VDTPPSPSPSTSTSTFVPTSAADVLLRFLSESRHPSAVSRQPTPVTRHPSPVWPDIVALASSHGLAPLLFKRLKESDARADVPAEVWERLRLAYFASAGRNIRLYRELGPVLRCLRSHDIPVIVLKGAFLAEAVYGDVALRPMCDVDLMVPRADLPRAHAVLLDNGCVHHQQPPTDRNRNLPPRHKDTKPVTSSERREARGERRVARSGSIPVSGQSEDGESRFRRGSGLRLPSGVGFELHWTIVAPKGRFRLVSSGLWDRAQPATIAGVEVLALSPQDLLLHVCLHASVSHGLGMGLRPFCDIAETIRRYRNEMDWAQVVARSREWDAARYTGLTLHLARSMLGAAVPEDVLEQLVPGGIDQRVLDTARETVLKQTGYGQWGPFFDLLGVESIGDKAKVFRERVFLSRGEMAAIYPASRDAKHLWFYYALRLRDVARTLTTHTLKRARLKTQGRGQDRKTSLVNWLRSGER